MEGSPVRQLIVSLALLLATPALADTLKLQDNAPEAHIVVKGDTLWDISARFLKDPWRWPQLWNLNREGIKNPHRIYPGDMIVLDRSGASPRLSLVRGGNNGLPTVKLSPGVRATDVASEAVPAIPLNAIHAFLNQPLLVTQEQLYHSPEIVGTNEERVFMTVGDFAYATSDESGTTRWQMYRQGQALTNPDDGKILGYEAEYLGDAETVVPGNPQKLRITRVSQEILSKDKLFPARDHTEYEFVPHAPEKPISGKVISAYGSTLNSNTGRLQTIIINRGAADGIEPGHVLAVYRTGKLVKMDRSGRQRWVYMDYGCIKPGEEGNLDPFYKPGKVMEDCKPEVEVQAGPWAYMDVGCLKPGKKVSFDQNFDPREVYDRGCTDNKLADTIQLPDARTGLVMVYRVFDHVSYALIMKSERPVYLLDTVKNP
ncbi:MAG: hypothetical protein QG662_328 [Pseudomonadota bacterium]|nr:hypothetical protein [Pseudomonadota bacterium]